MLLDHGDTSVHCFFWCCDLAFFAVDPDLSGCCVVQAIQNLHDRTLTGSILSQKSYNFALVDRDGNIIICQYFGKAFGNVFQFYNRLIHDFAIPFPYKIDSAKRHCQSGNSYSHQRLLFCFREILCEIDLAICDILCCLLNCTLAFI